MTGKVLCISAGAVSRLYRAFGTGWFCSSPEELEAFRKLVVSYSYFVERDRAEHDTGFVQLIPSCVIARGSKILCLERAANSSRLELKSKWTSLFGGHVDEADRDRAGNWQTIMNGVKREVHEELGIRINGRVPILAGLAIDPTNSTGRLHLGVVFYYTTDLNAVKLTDNLDLAEFNIAKLGVIHFFSQKEVYRLQDQFDPWSTLFLKSKFAKTQLREDDLHEEDLPLLRMAQ